MFITFAKSMPLKEMETRKLTDLEAEWYIEGLYERLLEKD